MYSTQDDDRMYSTPDTEADEFDIDDFACFGLCDDEEESAVADYDFSETPAQTGARMNITYEQTEAVAQNAVANQPLPNVQTPVLRKKAAFPINVVYNARANYMPEGMRALRLINGDDHFVLEAIAKAEKPFKKTLIMEFMLPMQFSMQRASGISPTMHVLVNGVDKTSDMPRAYMHEDTRMLTWEWTPPANSDISMVMLRLPMEVEGDIPAAGARTTVRVTYGDDRPIVATAVVMPTADYRSGERVRRPVQVTGMEEEPKSGLSEAARASAVPKAANPKTALQAVAATPPVQQLPSASPAVAYATARRAVAASVAAPMAAILPATSRVSYPAAQIPQMEVNTMSELPPIITNPDAFNPDGSSVYGDRIRFMRSEETVERDTMLSPGQPPAPAVVPALPQGPSEFQSRIVFRRAFPG